MSKQKKVFLFAIIIGLIVTGPSWSVPVDIELQLLVDISSSIDAGEFVLQRDGYADVFRDSTIQNAILNGEIGAIAIQMIYWSGPPLQNIVIDWTLVDSAVAANTLADAITAAARPAGFRTAPGSAINFGSPLFEGNGFEGTRLIIDISGDGGQNVGDNTGDARDAALGLGVNEINGLVIGGDSVVFDFYQENVIGGPNSFTELANDFTDFGDAVNRKIFREVNPNPVPEPSTYAMMALGLLGLGYYQRRKR